MGARVSIVSLAPSTSEPAGPGASSTTRYSPSGSPAPSQARLCAPATAGASTSVATGVLPCSTRSRTGPGSMRSKAISARSVRPSPLGETKRVTAKPPAPRRRSTGTVCTIAGEPGGSSTRRTL